MKVLVVVTVSDQRRRRSGGEPRRSHGEPLELLWWQIPPEVFEAARAAAVWKLGPLVTASPTAATLTVGGCLGGLQAAPEPLWDLLPAWDV